MIKNGFVLGIDNITADAKQIGFIFVMNVALKILIISGEKPN